MILPFLAFVWYWLATFALVMSLHGRPAQATDATLPPLPRTTRWWPWFAGLAVFLHAAAHAWVARLLGAPDMHIFAAISLVTLGMAGMTLALKRQGRMTSAGLVVFPLASLAVLAYQKAGHTPTTTPQSWPLQLHAWIALLSAAALALAAVFALMLWLQERALRTRQRSHLLLGLPPLVTIETMLFRTIKLGFALLTLTLVTGLLFVSDLFAQHLAHKTILSIVSWLIFGGLLLGRWKYGWRGVRAAKWTLVAFAFLALAFFGVTYILEQRYGLN